MTTAPVLERPAAAAAPADDASITTRLRAVLDRQRASYLADGPPTSELRIDRLQRAIGLLVDHQDRICEALDADFGHRSREQTLLTDVMSSVDALKFARKRVRRWMKRERRSVMFPLGLFGARAWIEYQPLGVVGVISPWNFPINLTFAPLAGILAAGNRVMIKPSEYTPATSELMRELIAGAYDETEIAVLPGGPDVGRAFTTLPFDHLLFTGATEVARHVMRAAAENLVPVTLELGGKSPVVIGPGADMALAAKRVMTGKMMNAGQICLAPDYVFVPDGRAQDFVAAAKAAAAEMYPALATNPDYTSVVNERHRERLTGYLEDARRRGAEVVEVNPAGEDAGAFAPKHKMAPAIVLEPSDDAQVMQHEIFGPLLPVRTYRTIDEVIDYVNARPRPLALYHFGGDSAERETLLRRTTSGGVTLDDVVMHVAMEDLPFGGVGASGMGRYHGRDGFVTFSNPRAVFKQARFDVGKLLRPPYGKGVRSLLKRQISK
jgi:coniferyl-aldehyde dehydrogenase